MSVISFCGKWFLRVKHLLIPVHVWVVIESIINHKVKDHGARVKGREAKPRCLCIVHLLIHIYCVTQTFHVL